MFRAVSRAVGKFERRPTGSPFRGWLWTIARNKTRDHARAKAGRLDAVGGTQIQRRLGEIPDIEESDSEDESLEQLTEDDEHRMLHAVLEMIRGEFESKTWTAFWPATVHGHTAADLGLSRGEGENEESMALRPCVVLGRK